MCAYVHTCMFKSLPLWPNKQRCYGIKSISQHYTGITLNRYRTTNMKNCLTLMMKAVHFSETPIYTCKATLSHSPEYHNLKICSSKKLKTYKIWTDMSERVLNVNYVLTDIYIYTYIYVKLNQEHCFAHLLKLQCTKCKCAPHILPHYYTQFCSKNGCYFQPCTNYLWELIPLLPIIWSNMLNRACKLWDAVSCEAR